MRMERKMRLRERFWHWLFAAVAACLALAVACGGETGSSHGGETHWLRPCTESSECGGDLGCSCGVCTRPCEASAECGSLGSDAACSEASATEYASACSSAELAQSFCVAEGSLASGGSAGAGSGGTGASSGASSDSGAGGSGGTSDRSQEPDAENVCQDVPDACDSGPCFTVCGVNMAILDAPELSGFAVDPQPARYGTITDVGDVTLAARGSRWLVTEAGSDQPSGELVYPGLMGPIVAGDRVFLRDSRDNLLRLNLDDPTAPKVDERWAPEVDFSEPDLPVARAEVYATSRDELVFRVGKDLSFVDVSGNSPQEVACVELQEPESSDDWYSVVHVTDDVIVQSAANEEEESKGYLIYNRDGDGEVIDTLEAPYDAPVHFWQDRMVVYTDTDPPRLALYELSASGATQLGETDLPEGVLGFEWSGGSPAGLVTFEEGCDETGCAALDITSDPPFAEYRVDSELLSWEACTGLATATGDAPDFWLSPRLSPHDRFAESPDVDCGPTEHVSWGAERMAWSPDGTQLALFNSISESTSWLRLWEPGSDEATTLAPSDDDGYYVDRLWWDANFVIGHTGYTCDIQQDWLYLHDVTDPESLPLRVDLPGPMIDMDVAGGRIWAIGFDGAIDCALPVPDPPKTMWFLELADPNAGFTEVELPEGSDPVQIHAAAGGVQLLSSDRIDVLDAVGEPIEVVDYSSPYDPATASSDAGLFVRDPDRLQYLAPGADALASETADCSERFPVAADTDFVYLSSRVPGGAHQATAHELTRVAVDPSGSSFALDVAARLPWGDPSSVVVSDDGTLALRLNNELLILR